MWVNRDMDQIKDWKHRLIDEAVNKKEFVNDEDWQGNKGGTFDQLRDLLELGK